MGSSPTMYLDSISGTITLSREDGLSGSQMTDKIETDLGNGGSILSRMVCPTRVWAEARIQL